MTMEDGPEIKINGSKFRFSIRDMVQAGITVMACVGLYFAVAQRTNTNSDAIDASKIDREKMWTEIARMNENGTRHSHDVDGRQQQQIDLLLGQEADIAHQLGDLRPKVDKIDTNVLWLMAKQLEHK